MQTALLQLAEDFLSTLVFLGMYLAGASLPLATGAALAVGVGQIALAKWRGRRVEVMQWLSLALVIALGAAALITDDSRFMMAKPSVVHFAVGSVMLRQGWMARYLPTIVTEHVGEGVLVATGYAWAGLMFALGLTNLYVAAECSPAAWAWFISVGAIGAKILALAAQYLVFQALIRRELPGAQPKLVS